MVNGSKILTYSNSEMVSMPQWLVPYSTLACLSTLKYMCTTPLRSGIFLRWFGIGKTELCRVAQSSSQYNFEEIVPTCLWGNCVLPRGDSRRKIRVDRDFHPGFRATSTRKISAHTAHARVRNSNLRRLPERSRGRVVERFGHR